MTHLNERIGYIKTPAVDFFKQLQECCCDTVSVKQRYGVLRDVFYRAVEQEIADSPLNFVGIFAKLDHLVKERNIPLGIASLLHLSRKDLFPEHNRKRMDEEVMERDFGHNLKATALLVSQLAGNTEIPQSLRSLFPQSDRTGRWSGFDEKLLRVIVDEWDEHIILATAEETGETVRVCYDETNANLTRNGQGDWSYLNNILRRGSQLNLLRVRNNDGVLFPELIIYEPDYLINVTTVASCFETYAESPFVALVNKIKPQPNTASIHLGNLAGQFLDDTVHRREVDFDDALGSFVKHNALAMISCEEICTSQGFIDFRESARLQQRNIRMLMGEDFARMVNGYDSKNVRLEPSFISEVLGIQGRLDLLYENNGDTVIVEQKSGKGEFVSGKMTMGDANVPVPKETHMVQLMLYRALFVYEYQRFASQMKYAMLLYSKYTKGLVSPANVPQLLLRAVRMRNLLAWCEMNYAERGMMELASLTPEKLNKKGISGRLWEQYVCPQLHELLSPIQNSTPLERMYYLRFMHFLEGEQMRAKLGSRQKENSGFACVWHDSLEEKKAAGNIYDELTIASFQKNDGIIEGVTMAFQEVISVDSSNFRVGDMVMLYPYRKGEVPNACAQIVNRAFILNITNEGIVLRLKNSQVDEAQFDCSDDVMWAIEHDMQDSSSGNLYSAMHGFLMASQRRKDLVLCQRTPDVDDSMQLKGDYGRFDELVLRAKQARDLFLIIGPPGTGKTSFGLVNLLKEELLEEGSNILLLSYTNRAVDEICSKLEEMSLQDDTFDYIRIGSEYSCAEQYRTHLLSYRSMHSASGGEVLGMIRSTRVFCATTSSVCANMSLFRVKKFSLAIVDEASQILEPHIIGILSAKNGNENAVGRFVLIGDHKQLPAVVQQTEEETRVDAPELLSVGLRDCRLSLFERFLSRFKCQGEESGYDRRFVYMLTRQGRMHEEIADFPNREFYGGKLSVVPLEHQLEVLPDCETDNSLAHILTHHRVAFIASERPLQSVSDKTNAIEAEMIAQTVLQVYLLNKERFDAAQTVGVIVPYRNQIAAVRSAIGCLNVPELNGIAIDTVERYQGSQRDYILYGFTIQRDYQLNFLSNNVFEEDDMIIDRKLNVAMTRARKHLVMIGNPSILNKNYTFSRLIDYTKQKNCFFPYNFCGSSSI